MFNLTTGTKRLLIVAVVIILVASMYFGVFTELVDAICGLVHDEKV